MALTKDVQVGAPVHIMGDQYSLPVTIRALDGVTEVFSKTINVDYKTNQTIGDAFARPQVAEQFQAAIDAFKQCKVIAAKTAEIQQAATILLNSLLV